MTHTEHRGHMTIGSVRRCVENWTAAGYPDELPVNVDIRETAEVDENGEYVVDEDYPLRALSITHSIPAKSASEVGRVNIAVNRPDAPGSTHHPAYETAVTAEDVLRTAQVRLCLLQKEEAPEIAHRLLWAAQCELDQATLALWRLGADGLGRHRAGDGRQDRTLQQGLDLLRQDLDHLIATLRLVAVSGGDIQPHEGANEFVGEPPDVGDPANTDLIQRRVQAIDEAEQVLTDLIAEIGA